MLSQSQGGISDWLDEFHSVLFFLVQQEVPLLLWNFIESPFYWMRRAVNVSWNWNKSDQVVEVVTAQCAQMQFQRLDSFHPMTSLDGEPTTLNFLNFHLILDRSWLRGLFVMEEMNRPLEFEKIQFLSTIEEAGGGEQKNQKPQNGADFVTSSPAVA